MTTALLLAWVLALAGILVIRQWQRRSVVTEAAGRPQVAALEQPVRVQKEFVFTYAMGVSPSIRVAAKESVEFASGWFELKDVDLTFFQDGQVAYGLVAQRARFHPPSSQAVVDGQPLLSLGGGVVARAQGFILEAGAQQLRSQGSVTFAGPGWGGMAGSLVGLLAQDAVTLRDGMTLVAAERGGQAVTLVAPVAEYWRRSGMVEFPEGLSLFRGLLHFAAQSGRLFLASGGGHPEKAELFGSVTLSGRSASGEVVEGQWGHCVAEQGPEGRWRFLAEASPDQGWVWLRVAQTGAEVRELRTWRLRGEADVGGLLWLAGEELACAFRVRPAEIPARLSAQHLRVEFDQGMASHVSASGEVVVEEANGTIRGDTLSAQLPQGSVEVSAPGGDGVHFISGPIQGSCQRLSLSQGGALTALGGVQGHLWREGSELRFAGRELRLGPGQLGPVTLFGEARVWEQNQVLRANEVVLYRDENRVVARGNVRLSRVIGAGSGGDVGATELTFNRERGEAVFRGAVQVRDGRGSIESESLLAYFSEQGELLRGEFSQGVVIAERGTGRRITGSMAVYEGARETLTVLGQPAVAEEPSGNRVQASRIVLDRRTGSMEVGGELDAPSQTLYHPQEGGSVPTRRTPLPRP
ncbi:MAG: hypothetical protein N2447_07335 [Thermoanaerobaculum sp.]|nr:hypothetical protein [Thermoanaerobaculum sp.]